MILRLPPKTYQESSHTIDKLWNSSQKSFLHFWVDGATTHTCNQNFLEQSKSFILANTFNNFLCAVKDFTEGKAFHQSMLWRLLLEDYGWKEFSKKERNCHNEEPSSFSRTTIYELTKEGITTPLLELGHTFPRSSKLMISAQIPLLCERFTTVATNSLAIAS